MHLFVYRVLPLFAIYLFVLVSPDRQPTQRDDGDAEEHIVGRLSQRDVESYWHLLLLQLVTRRRDFSSAGVIAIFSRACWMPSGRLHDALCAAALTTAADPAARVDVHRLDVDTPDFECLGFESLDSDCIPAFDEAAVNARAGIGAQVPTLVHQLLGRSNVGALHEEPA